MSEPGAASLFDQHEAREAASHTLLWVAEWLVEELEWPVNAPRTKPPGSLRKAIAVYIWGSTSRDLRDLYGVDDYDTVEKFAAYIDEWDF